MSNRLLLDTNVLIDALFEQRPQSAEARSVLARCNGSGDYGMVCAVSLKDVYYVSQKTKGEQWARQATCMLMGLVSIAPVSAEELDEASRSNEPDFEDGIVRICAELNDADFIITRDKAAFTKSSVRSVTAAEYLAICE